jgi:integrase
MSTRKTLTDIAVRNMKPGTERREVPDGGQANLYIIVQPSGRRGYAVRYRFAGKPQKLTLPRGLSLADARVQAAAAMAQVAKGIDPAREKKDEKDRAAIAAENTLRAVAENYMKLEAYKLRSRKARQSILDRQILPRLGSKPIAEIERDDVVRVLDKVAIESGPRAADMGLAVLRRLFNWHETRTSKFRTPLVRRMARLKPTERARKRVLSDDEVRRIWAACGDVRLGLFGPCVKFLLLTAARRNEAAHMERRELEGVVWTLPAARSKTAAEVVRPLSPAAMAILAEVPHVVGSRFVFSTDGTKPLRLDSKRKDLLDKISGTTGWTLHDLRRTARTLLGKARVPFDIGEQCLGHKLTGGLVRATYDQHDYLAERAEAFAALAREIERIIHPAPEGGKVVALRR